MEQERSTYVGYPSRNEGFSCSRCRIELQAVRESNDKVSETFTGKAERRQRDLQGIFEVLVDLHDRRLIAASVTVIGSREDRNDVAVVRPVAGEGRVETSAVTTKGEHHWEELTILP